MKEYSCSNEQYYIDAKELYDELGRCIESGGAFGVVAETLGVVKQRILSFPRADVAPIIHAHWIKVEKYPPFYKCSNCNVWVKPRSFFIQLFSFCPNCGAIMDEKERYPQVHATTEDDE